LKSLASCLAILRSEIAHFGMLGNQRRFHGA
jgi:hypothetical protein